VTNQDLQQGVQQETKRQQFFDPLGNDVTQTALQMFVNQGLKSIQRLLVIRDAEATATFTIGPGNYPYALSALTPPYRYATEFWLQGASSPLYRYQTVKEFHQDYPPSVPVSSGTVTRGYCIYDGSVFLGPAPVQDWTFFLDYVTWLAPLSAAGDSNWYTMNADDACLFFACRQAAAWLMEDQLYQFYDGLGMKALDEVRKTLRSEEVAEGQWQGRLFGSFRSTGQPAARSRGAQGPGWMP
jgi:hypothetical protein